jgi:hypothetical protein
MSVKQGVVQTDLVGSYPLLCTLKEMLEKPLPEITYENHRLREPWCV